MKIPHRLAILLCVLVSAGTSQVRDISGTWIAKMSTPMGELEIVYRLRVDSLGNITGSQTLPFGDAPITRGKVNGDEFEFTVQLESFGNMQARQVKGKIVGDDLQLTPAMPGPPPGSGAGPAPGGPGAGPAAGSPGAGPAPGGAGGPPPMGIGLITARRGTPTPSYRVSIDYKSLPHLELPLLRQIASTGVAKTPPMGWNSWNKFHTNIDDQTVRAVADAMVASGMRDAGYVYVNIDDGWQGARDANGVLHPSPKFPDMNALADYVHSKGLKLGIYSSPGPQTCGGFAGSYGHEDLDAKTWADWGVDYLKYDWCSASRIWTDADMRAVYQRMGAALQKTGRPVVYALCQYGRANVQEWGPNVGASLWRVTGDIQDSWPSMSHIGFAQIQLAGQIQPGSWNDPDMLEIGNGGMSVDEYKTHLSLWAMLSAPLIAGNDVRAMTPEIKNILLNREVIAVDQDALGSGVYLVSQSGSAQIWAKRLKGGNYAIALFNTGDTRRTISVTWADLDLTGPFRVRTLWNHSDLGSIPDRFAGDVPSHGVAMIRLSN